MRGFNISPDVCPYFNPVVPASKQNQNAYECDAGLPGLIERTWLRELERRFKRSMWSYKPADNTVGYGNKWSRWELWSDKDEGAKSEAEKPRYSPVSLANLYYLLSFALDVSFVAFLAHPLPSNPFASKIPRKNSSYIAELSGTSQKKNRTIRDVRKRMLKVQGFKLASQTMSCQLLSCQTFKYTATVSNELREILN